MAPTLPQYISMLANALSVQVGLSRGWTDKIDDDANGRGFACAIGTKEAVNLTTFHRKV